MTEAKAIQETLAIKREIMKGNFNDSDFKDWLDTLFDAGLIDDSELNILVSEMENVRMRAASSMSKLFNLLMSCVVLITSNPSVTHQRLQNRNRPHLIKEEDVKVKEIKKYAPPEGYTEFNDPSPATKFDKITVSDANVEERASELVEEYEGEVKGTVKLDAHLINKKGKFVVNKVEYDKVAINNNGDIIHNKKIIGKVDVIKDVHIVYDDNKAQTKPIKWDGRQSTLADFLKNVKGKATIGYGNTAKSIVKKGYLTDEDAATYKKNHIKRVIRRTKQRVELEVWERMNLDQRAVMVSLFYNMGTELGCPLTLKALKDYFVDAKTIGEQATAIFETFPYEFEDCNKVTVDDEKVVSDGLTNRRIKEREIFMVGVRNHLYGPGNE